MRALTDNSCEHKTDGDEKLVTRDNGTANSLGSNFGHIQDNDGRDEANTEACDEAAGDEKANGRGGDLKNNTDGEDYASSDNGRAATNPIGYGACAECTEEGAGRENRDDKRLLPGEKLMCGTYRESALRLSLRDPRDRIQLCYLRIYNTKHGCTEILISIQSSHPTCFCAVSPGTTNGGMHKQVFEPTHLIHKWP